MANGSDGSIVIDTELDNTGFQQGSKELEKAIRDAASAFDNFGDNVMSSFSKVVPLLQSIADSASQISASLGGTATQAAEANERITESEQHVTQAAQEAAQAVGQQGQNMGSLTSGANTAQQSISALEKEVNSLSTGMAAISRSAETGFANGNAVLSFDAKLSDMEAKLAAAREKLEAFAQTKIPTEDYQWLTAAIQKAETEYDKLIERQAKMEATGVKQNSKEWENLQYDISIAQQKIAEYRADMAWLENSDGAFTTGADTTEYQRMSAIIGQTAESIERNRALIDSEALAQARLNVQAAQEQVVRATTASEREAAVARLRDAQQQLNDLASSMSNRTTDTAPEESSISGWQRFGSALKTAASSALKMAGSLAKIGFNAAKAGINSLIGKLKSFVSQGKKSRSMAESLAKSLTSLKRMLITRIKRMFISSIFNSAKESLQTLAQFSDAFNQSMSNIKNSAKGLSANLAVSLGGLISAIEPVLTKIINMISTAISYLNAFFAMLGGKSTMTVAKKQTESYADSLDGAAGAAEELKNQVYGFDELNKRSDNSNSGGGGSSADDLFEEVPIDSVLPEEIQNLFQSIKDAIAAGDWFGVGGLIADGLNAGMQVVDDWINNTFRPMGVQWAKNIAELLNGLVDGFDWELLGKTVADGINAVADIVNTFFTTFDFKKLGEGIGTAINGLFDNIDWALLGQMFANKWNALIHTIQGIVETVDWSGVGNSAAEFVNNWVETIDWAGAAKGLSDGIKGLLTTINTFLEETDWKMVGEKIKEFIVNIDWTGIVAGLAEGLGAALGGLAALLWGLIEEAWNSVVEWWKETAYEDGKFTIEGLLQGIWDVICNIGTWIYENIFKPFIDGFKKAFGIASPSTVMEEQGNFIVEGLLNGIKNTWKKITEFFSTALDTVKTTLSNAWSDIKSTASTAWGNIKTTVTEKFDAAKTALSNTATNVKTSVSNAWNNLKSATTTAWENIKSTTTTKFDNAKTTIVKTADTIKSNLSTAWTNIKSTATSTWENIKSTVTQKFDNLKSTISTTTNTIKSNLSTAWDSVKSTASTKWESVKSTVTTKWNTLKSTLNNTDWKSVGSNICTGIKNGIDAGWTWLKNTVSNLASNLLSAAKRALGIASPSKVFRDEVGQFIGLGLAEGIEDTASTVVKTVKNLADATVDGFDSSGLSLDVAASDTVSGLDIVANKLSGIAETFRTITSQLTGIGSMSFPAITTGQVIPMKTKIDTSSLPNVSLTGFDNFSNDVDEYMGYQSDLLRQILEILRKLHLSIDIDDLTAAITAKQNATVRSYGGV